MRKSTASRRRTVSATSAAGPQDEELAPLINALSDVDDSSFDALRECLEQSACLQQLRYNLADHNSLEEVKDAFRRQRGFQKILALLGHLARLYDTSELSEEDKKNFHFMNGQALAVLATALQEHAGNQKYFRTRVDGGGWRILQSSLAILVRKISGEDAATRSLEKVFGMLFATAVAQEMLYDVYASVSKDVGASFPNPSTSAEENVDVIRKAVSKAMTAADEVSNPELLSVLIDLWLPLIPIPDNELLTLRCSIPTSIVEALSRSSNNIVAAHTAGLLSRILLFVLENNGCSEEKILYHELALVLSTEGLTSLDDAHMIFSKASTSSVAASFLQKALISTRTPASIQFDLSLCGYSSLELSSLGRTFPPLDTAGYTIALWAKFDHFDSNAHTTVFGAFDSSQTCFVLAYVEKDTRSFILQTSIRGSKPSVRFKSTKFVENRWYHICIVHRRPRTMSTSRAHLFIDGEFVEQVKATYPTPPPNTKASGNSKVQAFFGTPRDLSQDTTKGSCFSKWSLASSLLYQDVFSDDLISVIYNLGPGYHGNFQDCLGTFQTYQASAALNLRNENLNAGKEDQSDVILAIRQKASGLVRESNILLNVSPAAVLDGDDRNNINESQLIKSLSKIAAKNLQQYIRSGSNAVAINGAVPAINLALTHAQGIAILTGAPAVAVPQSLDDAAWRLGGCTAVALSLVHAAKTTEDVLIAVKNLFEMVLHSWRNSEGMEKLSGYAILSTLLHDKLGLQGPGDSAKSTPAIPTSSLDRSSLALELLKSVLAFLGYDLEHKENSVINNPLAYRILLIDTNVWRRSTLAVQELYFGQFLTFAVESVQYRFNVKRLTRMRVLKKLLEALKSEVVSSNIMSSYMTAFKALLPSAMSAEMLRSLALFVTYAVNKRSAPLQSRRSTKRDLSPRMSISSSSTQSNEENTSLSRFEIGVEVLRLYSNFLCAKGDANSIRKFARTVTNKWLLYLMSETSPEVVVLATRILARLLVVHGEAYVKKFKDKSGGFAIMRHRLKRWWHLPALWPAVFAIIFNFDIGKLNLERSFDLFGLLDLFDSGENIRVVYPDAFTVVHGMLQSGIKTVVHSKKTDAPVGLQPDKDNSGTQTPQRLSMSTMAPPDPLATVVASSHIETLHTVVRFLTDLHGRSQAYRDYSVNSPYVQDLLQVLFPVVVGSDVVDAVVELNARDSALTFDGHDVVVQPLSTTPPIIRTAEVESSTHPGRGKQLSRGSSYIIVTAEQPKNQPSTLHAPRKNTPISTTTRLPELSEAHNIVQSILEAVISVFSDQILARKDFPGLGLFLRTPPGFVEHQSYFESWILRNTLSQLSNTIMLDQKLLCETRVLTNLARLFSHLGEALFEGWFIGGADSVLDLSGAILEYLQRPDVSKIKNVRLCNQATSTIRAVVFKTVLLSLSQMDDSNSLAFLEKLTYWQTVLLSSEETQSSHLQLVCYLLYASLISTQPEVRMAAANLWRIILIQKPDEAASILGHATSNEHRKLISSFEKLIEVDNDTFLYWVDDHRDNLDSLFFDVLSQSWDNFVTDENKKTEETARNRVSRRREKLKQWTREESDLEELIRRHEVTFDHWTANIYASEYLKHQRVAQDHQDDLLFTTDAFSKMQQDVRRPIGFLAEQTPRKWRLDQTEGRNRMRLRLNEDFTKTHDQQQPKRKGSETPRLRLDTRHMTTTEAIGLTPVGVASGGTTPVIDSPHTIEKPSEPFPDLQENGEGGENAEDADESFEMIDDPNEGQDAYEDKNRKVMRSLHRGDQVKHVANISRIVGLEAVEGLLILGKDHLYLTDNFFQRADGEIMNVWQAPQEERDPYVRMISGRDVVLRKTTSLSEEHESRSWKWTDIISISKRRFLFRDVAVELFFADGRSYLLTVMSPKDRDELHTRVSSKTLQYGSTELAQSENAWRYEALRSPDEEPQTIGSRFANVFNQSSSYASTRKWQKGEMSNFHYLMHINTMAGRTYNDLTQYPVFPWIIADYTSDELDLSNPKTFRDLSKPMGCQTVEREAEFRERYKLFAEMGDHNSPAFHYGTHYSSAMIVTSYLIRLQPFVKSYLLLQGGTFDHADRMFYSIEKTWVSASRQNMTDVRELTPEFFYLPEFLTNVNEYDFGMRQNSDKSIGSVELPPWAKGDPKIFISKHREALESPYISRNLHKWIDLIFGSKQKGEAAFEAVNVFHHLSYQGAKDLDNISDPVERLATIGIIHNFGQTPFQVFHKPHVVREEARHKYKRLDTAAESLTRLPSLLLDDGERVASLCFSWKQERLLCAGAFRLNIPPVYDKYMEWGFSDNSVRFYSTDSRRLLGHFEHVHIGQLSCAAFVDSKTLITSGTDCTIGVWNVTNKSKSVDIQLRSNLFGHRKPATTVALSRSFNALLTASVDGEIILWDLNRTEFVRKVPNNLQVECAAINDVTGNLILCHGSRISIYTLNGEFLLEQDTNERLGDKILSCACYEGAGNEWLERDILFTGHRWGIVKIWNKVIRNGKFELELIRQLNHADPNREDGGNVVAGISCILPMPQVVYTGDEDGRVCEWNCVQRH